MSFVAKLVNHGRQHRLAYRVSIYILLCSSLFALVTTAMQTYMDYHQERHLINKRLAQIQASYADSLANSLWALDYSQILLQMQGILQFPDIKYVELITATRQNYNVGQLPKGSIISHRFPIYYNSALDSNTKQVEYLGTLDIVASLEGSYQRLYERVLFILVIQVAQFFLMAIIILMIFQYLVTRHLETMASFALRFNPKRPDQFVLELNRRRSRHASPDELDRVVEAINLMCDNLWHSYKDLEQKNRLLEQSFHRSQTSEEKFRNLIEGSIQGILIIGTDDIFGIDERPRFANQALADMFGYDSPADIIKLKSITQLIAPYDRQRVLDYLKQYSQASMAQQAVSQQFEFDGLRKDGSTIHLANLVRAVKWSDDPQNNHVPKTYSAIQNTYVNITKRKRAEANLLKLSQAIEQSPASVLITDAMGRIEYVNQHFCEITGFSAQEVLGQSLLVMHAEFISKSQYQAILESLRWGQTWRDELSYKKKDGTRIWEYASISALRDDRGAITNFLVVKEDITELKSYKEKLDYDDLTKLPNRLLAFDRLSQILLSAHRDRSIVALLLIDLDRFKHINETLGHTVGDQLLKHAAQLLMELLKNEIREDVTLSRLGGDEFLAILPDLREAIDAEEIASKIIDEFSKPFLLEQHEIYVTTSIGITIYPDDGNDAKTLLRNVDVAMYRAKEAGRNTYCFFTAEMNRQAQERLILESYLRHALERNELVLYYQPLVDARNGQLVGAEALLRWHHPQRGLISPDQFIKLSEETGLIVPIGEWALKNACQTAKRWQGIRYGSLSLLIAVNISPRQMRDSDFVERVENILKQTGLPPRCLELEITESLLVEDFDNTFHFMEDICDLGVRFSIDDFGTGYSSLNYLPRLPFDVLKIDRSFTRDITRNKDQANLTKAIIAMAHSLDLKVIAEGVETIEQWQLLRDQGCDIVQGYYFSRPLPEDVFTAFIKHFSPKSCPVSLTRREPRSRLPPLSPPQLHEDNMN